jgi:uncharacterized phage protein gp47/JayE
MSMEFSFRSTVVDELTLSIPPEIELYSDAGVLLDRLRQHPALSDLDTAQATVLWRILSPIANELAEAYVQLARVIWLRSLIGPVGQRAWGPYLDELGEQEMGVLRNSTVRARYAVTFTGPPGTLLAQGTTVGSASPPLEWDVVVGTVLGSDGSGGALVECRTPGTIGNVPAGAINRVLTTGLPGVTVINEHGTPLIAGADVESDDNYRVRLLRYRRDPPNGTNGAQFRTWAEQVPGVGRARTVRPAQTVDDESDPRRPPPGTVDIYIVGPALIEPAEGPLASSATVDAVQQWIAPAPVPVQFQAADWEGLDSQPLYATAQLPTERMRLAGVWTFRPRMALTDAPEDPASRVATLAAWNETDHIDLPSWPVRGGSARRELLAGELNVSPAAGPAGLPELGFYWDGIPANAGQLDRPGKDLRLLVEQTVEDVGALTPLGGWLVGQFSDPDHAGLADVADRVEVFAAAPVPLGISVTVRAQPGWGQVAVQASVRAALEAYLRAIVFGGTAPPIGGQPDPMAGSVLFGLVQAVIINAGGVAYILSRSLEITTPADAALGRLPTDDVPVWVGDVATLGALDCRVEMASS